MGPQPTIKSMRYFLEAVDTCSLTRAGESLHVVPSAISSAIDKLEAAFGVTLVHRFPAKGIRLSASGEAVARRIRHVVEEYDSLLLAGSVHRDSLSGPLNIGYYAPVAPAFLPNVVQPLLASNPGIRLHCEECDNERAQDGLLSGRYDAILFVAQNAKPGILCETLMEVPPYVLMAADHRLASRNSVDINELEREPMVLLDLPFTAQYLQGLFDRMPSQPLIVATATSAEMVRSLVGAGVGCSVLNMRPHTPISYAGDALVSIPIEPALPGLRLALGSLSGKSRRLVDVFKDSLIQSFATELVSGLVTTAIPPRSD